MYAKRQLEWMATAKQATRFGVKNQAVTPSFPCFLYKVNDPSLPYFLMFHHYSWSISVLVSLKNYSSLFAVQSFHQTLVVSPIKTIFTRSMEWGYQQIICHYPNSKIRVTKTHHPNGSKFCGLGSLTQFTGNKRNQLEELM